MKTYTSTKTGITYEVVPTNHYGWFRYSIRKDGVQVQFSLTEDGVAESVAWAEGYTDGVYSSRFD